jgi:putrescine aminotransferase
MISTNERQETLIDQHASLMNPSQARQMREAGLGIIESRREGPYVWDQSGIRYIDCRQETSIYNVGRRNPTMISSLKDALDDYDIGNSMFFSEPRVHLARKLGEISPGGKLRAVTYGVSGGEINDFALKLARAQTGRKRIIAMNHGYLGSTGFAASASGDPRFRAPFEPLIPDITFVSFGSIKELKTQMSTDVACVILESKTGPAFECHRWVTCRPCENFATNTAR